MSNILIGKYLPSDFIENHSHLDSESNTIKKSFNYLIKLAGKNNIKDIVCCVVDYSQFRHSHIADIFGKDNLNNYKKNKKPFKIQNSKVNLHFETKRTLDKNLYNYNNALFFVPYVTSHSLKKTENKFRDTKNVYFLELYENDLRSTLDLNNYKIIQV